MPVGWWRSRARGPCEDLDVSRSPPDLDPQSGQPRMGEGEQRAELVVEAEVDLARTAAQSDHVRAVVGERHVDGQLGVGGVLVRGVLLDGHACRLGVGQPVGRDRVEVADQVVHRQSERYARGRTRSRPR